MWKNEILMVLLESKEKADTALEKDNTQTFCLTNLFKRHTKQTSHIKTTMRTRRSRFSKPVSVVLVERICVFSSDIDEFTTHLFSW